MTVQTQIGRITASKETLHNIAVLVISAKEAYRINGYKSLERKTEKIISEIYRELEEAGYYKK